MKSNFNKIYLDYAATTPVDSAVLHAMRPYFFEKFGNAGSLHSFGQEAIAAVDRSRDCLARAISAEFREIIFTSSATEANNLALRGIPLLSQPKADQPPAGKEGLGEVLRVEKQNPSQPPLAVPAEASARRRGKGRGAPRVIVSAIEHESVLETARALERHGVEVIYLPVNKAGVVDLKKLKASLNENTILVSIMYVNNEIGTVQPIAEIAKVIQEFKVQKVITPPSLPSPPSASLAFDGERGGDPYPLFHVDASQAFQFFDCDVNKLGVDLMTLSSHKIYGPKGAACLYIRDTGAYPLSTIHYPLLFGGGQEFGFRSGTENVPAIVGFAKAVELASSMREKELRRVAEVHNYFWRGIKKIFPEAQINGVGEVVSSQKLVVGAPHILNVYFPNHAAQDVLTRLDLAGIAASSGSACRSRAMESSYVIEALGYSKTRAKASVRFSFGRQTTKKEIDATLKVLKEILK
jgi:cysteine desulfurase